ncbi:RNA-directed DNA polymerase, eukaryota, reverse transcriptase zinc-binding domain protein [Tanacetum coccineum]
MSGTHLFAGDCIPDEVSPAMIPQRHVARETYPQRQVARETYPQRQVARESPDNSPGIDLIACSEGKYRNAPIGCFKGCHRECFSFESDKNDSWQWSLDGSNGFSVVSVRELVDSHTLDVDLVATRWNRSIPIKVNVFLWRLKLNRLPSRVNLDWKGINVGSILCPICHDDVETVNHIFFNCGMAKDLWALLAKWWEMDYQSGMIG